MNPKFSAGDKIQVGQTFVQGTALHDGLVTKVGASFVDVRVDALGEGKIIRFSRKTLRNKSGVCWIQLASS